MSRAAPFPWRRLAAYLRFGLLAGAAAGAPLGYAGIGTVTGAICAGALWLLNVQRGVDVPEREA